MNSHCANSCFMPFSFSLVLSLGQLIGRSEQMLELIRSPKLVTGPGVAEHSGGVAMGGQGFIAEGDTTWM
jgi:hypothetical protein